MKTTSTTTTTTMAVGEAAAAVGEAAAASSTMAVELPNNQPLSTNPAMLNAKCVGCGLVGSLDSIIQHASTCKITVVVDNANKAPQTQTPGSDAQTASCQDLSWAPPSFSLLKRDGCYVSGIVNTEEELETLLANHKRATLSSYNQWSNNSSKKSSDPSRGRVLWQVEDYCEETPLSVTKRVIMLCQHGKEYASKTGSKAKDDSLEHVYTRKKFIAKRVKKFDCPAKVFIRHVKRYDTFSMKGQNLSKYGRDETMKRLKLEMSKSTPPTSTFIHVKLPLVEAHQNHPMDSACGTPRRKKRRRVKDKTSETAEPITQQQGAQPPHTDTPSSAPLDTARPERHPRPPKTIRPCPLCFKPYATVASHLRKVHKVFNKEERALLLDLAAKRVDIRDAACPIPGCPYKSDRLYTHLLAEGHPGLSKEEAEGHMDAVRKERTIGLLAALRASNPCPPMATALDLQIQWACMVGEQPQEQLVEEEAYIPTYEDWVEQEEQPQCGPYEPECSQPCRQAHKKLSQDNRRLQEQLSQLRVKYKQLERKHRVLCEAAGVPMPEAGACGRGRGRKPSVKKRRSAGPEEEERHGLR